MTDDDETIAGHLDTAQVLLAHLDEIDLGPKTIVHSPAAREEAERFIASFVRGEDDPEDPIRFGRIAKEAADVIVNYASAQLDDAAPDEWEDYLTLRNGLAALFVKEGVSAYRE